ncbi:uncharacterized protein [Chlorocebus sabaeus]|uniref:uncharacterized protein isoform X2 n=1 Tax=Chlorocebus sabaeus TaxID=60711 RepID=UPI003BF983EA
MASGSCSPGRALASPDPGIDMDEHAIRLTHHPTSSSALMTFASTPLKPPQDTVSHGQDGAFQSCSDGALRPNPALQGAGAETHSRTPSTPDSQHKISVDSWFIRVLLGSDLIRISAHNATTVAPSVGITR